MIRVLILYLICAVLRCSNGVSQDHVAATFSADGFALGAPVQNDKLAVSLVRREAAETTTKHPDTKGEFSKGIWAGKYVGEKAENVWKEDHEVGKHMAKAVAWILIGTVGTLMGLVYLVHFPDDHVKHATWHTISNAVSLFCAVLFFKVLKLGIKVMKGKKSTKAALMDLDLGDLNDETEGGSKEPDAATMISYFMLFIVFFVMLECFLLLCKRRPLNLAAWGLTGAHLVGFMAAYAFGTLQMAPPFRDSAGASFGMIFIATLVIGFMCTMSGSIRSLITSRDGSVDKMEHAWQHQCVHTEDEIIAFAVGLLITQSFRFTLMGEIPYFSGPQFNDNNGQIVGLFFIAVLFLILTVLSDLVERFAKSRGAGDTQLRCWGSLTCIMAMTSGWSLLFWGKWFFWRVTGNKGMGAEGNILLMQMEMAVMFSVVSFAVIIAVDFLGDRFPGSTHCLTSISEAFALLISLSWEALFMTAIAEAMHDGYASKTEQLLQGSKLCFVLCLFIFPGWVLYILPKAMQGHGHAHDEKNHGSHGNDHGHGDHADKSSEKADFLADGAVTKPAVADVAATAPAAADAAPKEATS